MNPVITMDEVDETRNWNKIPCSLSSYSVYYLLQIQFQAKGLPIDEF